MEAEAMQKEAKRGRGGAGERTVRSRARVTEERRSQNQQHNKMKIICQDTHENQSARSRSSCN
eukprot:6181301-Pleurochrysis_carterae.AAC.2